MLMDREDTCHRTCFSLHLDGNMLDHFSVELRSVRAVSSVLRVVEGLSGSRAASRGPTQKAGPGGTLPPRPSHWHLSMSVSWMSM